jgi:hypothetical protein
MGNERGVALVVAVLVMITATFLGIAAVMTSDICGHHSPRGLGASNHE